MLTNIMEEQKKILRKCSLKSCKTKSGDLHSIFKIPIDPVLCEKWKFFFKNHGHLNIDKIKVLRLCELHFDPSDIIKTDHRTHLRPGSVPSYVDRRVNKKIDLNIYF